MGKKLAIIIPTYNEKDNIESLVKKIVPFVKNISCFILFVDDNSPDNTGQEIERIKNRYNSKNLTINLLSRKNKQGLGSAYIDGFKSILKKNTFDYIIQMDADLSHDPKYIKKFLKEIDGNSMVIGSRYLNSKSLPDWKLSRKIVSILGNAYLQLVLRTGIKDYTTGFNIIDCDDLKKINLDEISSKGYCFQIELKYKLHTLRKKTSEIPIVFKDRRIGHSKLPKSTIISTLYLPIKLIVNKYLKIFLNWRFKNIFMEIICILTVFLSTTILLSIVYNTRFINYLLFDADSLSLALLKHSIFTLHSKFSYIGSSQLNLFPEAIFYLIASSFTKSIQWSFIISAYINIFSIYILIRLLLRQITNKSAVYRNILASLACILLMIIMASQASTASEDSSTALFFINTTYYYGIILTGLVQLAFTLYILKRESWLKKYWFNILILIIVGLMVASNPLYIAQITMPLIICLIILGLMKIYTFRKLLPIFIFNVLAVAIGFLLREPIKNMFAESLSQHISTKNIDVKNGFLNFLTNFGSVDSSLMSEFRSLLPLIIYFGLLIAFLKKLKNFRNINKIELTALIFILLEPVILITILVVSGSFKFTMGISNGRYCLPIFILPTIGLIIILIDAREKVKRNIVLIFLTLFLLITVLGMNSLKDVIKTSNSQPPDVACLEKSQNNRQTTGLAPYGLRYLSIYDTQQNVLQSTRWKIGAHSVVSFFPFTINKDDYKNKKINFILIENPYKVGSLMTPFNTLYGFKLDQTEYGQPSKITKCQLFTVYNYDTKSKGYKLINSNYNKVINNKYKINV